MIGPPAAGGKKKRASWSKRVRGCIVKISLITSVKNEGPYILEWLAYHKAIGFEDIFIFENDSSDLTDVLLQRLEMLGEIEFIKNTNFSGNPQFHSYRQFQKMDAYLRSDWVLCYDSDEFFLPRQHDTVQYFLQDHFKADAIAVNWLNFGTSNQKKWQDIPVTERFRKCAPPSHLSNRFFKSFHRPNGPFKGFGIHRPWPHVPIESYIYTDLTPVEPEVQTGKFPKHASNIEIRHMMATVNHYSIKSQEEFERKKLRGRPSNPDNLYGMADQKRYDTNLETDHGIDRFRERMQRYLQELKRDSVLSFLHHMSCLRQFPDSVRVTPD